MTAQPEPEPLPCPYPADEPVVQDPGGFTDDTAPLAGGGGTRTGEEAIAWATAQITRPTQDWTRYCLMFVRMSLRVLVIIADAGKSWDRSTRKHRTSDPMAIPRGRPVYWELPSVADHVALSLGDGWCLSTDILRAGKVDRVRIQTITDRWGGTLLGWTEDLNGVLIPKEEPVPAMTKAEQIAAAEAAGLVNVEDAYRAAERVGLPFWAACALLQKESGGRNVYGHDRGGAGPHGQPVTKANFEAFYARVLDGAVSNGVGPCQITYAGPRDAGKRNGGFFREMLAAGLKPWVPFDNMLYGFWLLRRYYTARSDTWRGAGTIYNGSATYGASFLALVERWHERFRVAGTVNPHLGSPPALAAIVPKPPKPKPAYTDVRIEHASQQFSDSPDAFAASIAASLKRGRPLIGLTEVGKLERQLDLQRLLDADGRYSAQLARGGSAVLTRLPVVDKGVVPVLGGIPGPPSKGGRGPRGIAWVTVRIGPEMVTAAVAHWPLGRQKGGEYEAAFDRMTSAMGEFAEEKSQGRNIFVWMADVNLDDSEGETGPAWVKFAAQGLVTCWDDIGEWPVTSDGRTIDVIGRYAPDTRARFVAARTCPLVTSDHQAVTATLRVKA